MSFALCDPCRSARGGPPARLALATACLLTALIALASASAAQGKPSCAGKRATIVSNAPRIAGTKAHDVIVAGAGANKIYGMGGSDTICAGGGNDIVYGGRGNDTIFGQGGEDTVHGERGSDDLFGGGGTDRLLGETGNDEIDGGAGDRDYLDGGAGDDTLDGGPGHADTVHGGVGNDRIDGGPGAHDIASYKGVGGPITVDLGSGAVSGAEGERLRGIEDALGGSGDDALIGDAGANRLDGGQATIVCSRAAQATGPTAAPAAMPARVPSPRRSPAVRRRPVTAPRSNSTAVSRERPA